MLTLKQIRDNKEEAILRLKKKGVDAAPIVEKIEQLDDRRKALQAELDDCLAQQNQAAKQIGALMGKGEREAAEAKKQEVAQLKSRSNELKEESEKVAEELQSEIVKLPNFPADIVPEGMTAEQNVVVKLVERDGALAGYYYYTKYGPGTALIALVGSVDENRNMNISGFNWADSVCEVWTGTFKEGQISAVFESRGSYSRKKYEFTLTEQK
jgi:seryl-tRNA synthetase